MTMSATRSMRCWPEVLQTWTGISGKELHMAVKHVNNICFVHPPIVDHEFAPVPRHGLIDSHSFDRNVEVAAVRTYAERNLGSLQAFAPKPADLTAALEALCPVCVSRGDAAYTGSWLNRVQLPAKEAVEEELSDSLRQIRMNEAINPSLSPRRQNRDPKSVNSPRRVMGALNA